MVDYYAPWNIKALFHPFMNKHSTCLYFKLSFYLWHKFLTFLQTENLYYRSVCVNIYICFVNYLYPFLTAYFYTKYKSNNLKILLTVHCISGLKFGCWFVNNSHMFSLNCL